MSLYCNKKKEKNGTRINIDLADLKTDFHSDKSESKINVVNDFKHIISYKSCLHDFYQFSIRLKDIRFYQLNP